MPINMIISVFPLLIRFGHIPQNIFLHKIKLYLFDDVMSILLSLLHGSDASDFIGIYCRAG